MFRSLPIPVSSGLSERTYIAQGTTPEEVVIELKNQRYTLQFIAAFNFCMVLTGLCMAAAGPFLYSVTEHIAWFVTCTPLGVLCILASFFNHIPWSARHVDCIRQFDDAIQYWEWYARCIQYNSQS